MAADDDCEVDSLWPTMPPPVGGPSLVGQLPDATCHCEDEKTSVVSELAKKSLEESAKCVADFYTAKR